MTAAKGKKSMDSKKQFFWELLLPRSDTTPSTWNESPINQVELCGQRTSIQRIPWYNKRTFFTPVTVIYMKQNLDLTKTRYSVQMFCHSLGPSLCQGSTICSVWGGLRNICGNNYPVNFYNSINKCSTRVWPLLTFFFFSLTDIFESLFKKEQDDLERA